MAYLQPDNELLLVLQSVTEILSTLNLSQCALIVKEIHDKFQKTIPNSVNSTSTLSKFHNLQTTSESEFGNTAHRSDIIKQLQDAIRLTVSNNQTEMRHILNESNVIEIGTMRINALRILRSYEQVIRRGSKTSEERMIGFSFYYMGLVDGVYRNSLRMCYIWEQLSHLDQVDTSRIWQTDVGNIQQYFVTNSLHLGYFEGWNRNVRNAVGHSTFHFDNIKNKMIYEDIHANSIVELSESELMELIENLSNVFEILLVQNQIFRVNDICDTFIQRYP
ncbi:MAG: hypothetical protein IIA83_00585 [Thaumarchaeota archaeon]|nr:hypothetical protein [Nitrososphaerota archaeon]